MKTSSKKIASELDNNNTKTPLIAGPEDLKDYIYKDLGSKETCCTLCPFRNKIPAKVKNHLEAIHFPGVFVYTCDLCGKTFKGRNALGVHTSLTHSKKY